MNISIQLSNGRTLGELTVVEHILNSRQFTQQTYNACLGLLRLADKYEISRLEAAAQRALLGYSVTYRAINSILSNGMDRQIIKENTDYMPKHENIRGPQNF